jgi:hypothetical protein
MEIAGKGCRQQRTRQHRYSVQFPERGWHDERVTINDRIEAARRERRVLTRVRRYQHPSLSYVHCSAK